MFALLVKDASYRNRENFPGRMDAYKFVTIEITRWLLFGILPIYVKKEIVDGR